MSHSRRFVQPGYSTGQYSAALVCVSLPLPPLSLLPSPQVLFNDTIMYNIRYAKPHATDEEVGRWAVVGGPRGRWGCALLAAASSRAAPPSSASPLSPFLQRPPSLFHRPLPHPVPGQVIEAAKAACIHDTIMSRFPLKYDTVVGERGLRLRCGAACKLALQRGRRGPG